ncbi:MFS transporter [Curtobacterium sp. MCBD17_030]|uniref:MFS transporter n=1 Tax=Curtobacterium sp. MCBD17_030 TaxID=2175649 RepID=UPI000D8B99ED|nr:MFS transporter [Curtobacterium sp. MCBD17_030]PYY38649.1 MFS transporter [Curtobacterium sp. MCBD17_030]
MTTTASTPTTTGDTQTRIPWSALVALAAIGFLLLSAETMPAGLLPLMARDLDTGEGVIGQFISVWALGTVVVTVPAITLTRGMRRKPLLLMTLTCLVLANAVTAISSDVVVSLVSRFVGGAATGVLWGMLAAYGRRISPPSRGGLALAIVSTGAPVGFALGTPLGAWVGGVLDWRWSFVGISVLGVVLLVLVTLLVPDIAGQPAGGRLPLQRVFLLRGVPVVLAVIFVWMLGHNTIYTYITPFLRDTGTGLSADLVLLVYGVCSIGGVVLTAALIDRYPRGLLWASLGGFVVAAVLLVVGHGSAPVVLGAAVLWGLTFGGAAPQLQSALTIAGGTESDLANAFLPVAFNLAISAAGLVGALLIAVSGGLVLAVSMAVLGALALVVTVVGRQTFAGRA